MNCSWATTRSLSFMAGGGAGPPVEPPLRIGPPPPPPPRMGPTPPLWCVEADADALVPPCG